MSKKPLGLITLTLIVLTVLAFALTCEAGGVKDWAGHYTYSEEPAKALAGYSMLMDWDLTVQKNGRAILEVTGQQTYFQIQAKATGDAKTLKLTFDKGLDGTGYEYIQKGDVLFQLKKGKGKITTWWNKLTPRLSEKLKNGTVCFVKE